MKAIKGQTKAHQMCFDKSLGRLDLMMMEALNFVDEESLWAAKKVALQVNGAQSLK